MARSLLALLLVAALLASAAGCRRPTTDLILPVPEELGSSRDVPSHEPAEQQPAASTLAAALTRPVSPDGLGVRPIDGQPSPTPAQTVRAGYRLYSCDSGPCPRTLEYAVNGCSCNGEIYDEDWVEGFYCCAAGFSTEPCPETLRYESLLMETFGWSEEEVFDQLVGVDLQTWPVLVHWKAQAAFQEVSRAIEGMEYRIEEPIDGFYWRVVEGSEVMSPHAFGIAVDLNQRRNPSCGITDSCPCYNDLVTDMPPEFVQVFKNAGFEWGGDWEGHPDPMHFEWTGWRSAPDAR